MSSSTLNCLINFLTASSPWTAWKNLLCSQKTLPPFLHPHKSGDTASPSNSPSIIANVFHLRCFLYWHLTAWMIPISSGCKWFVQCGGKNIILIFYRAMVFLVCAAHWSIKSKIFVFCPYLLIQLNKKLCKSRWSHPCIGICCEFGGEIFTFVKQWDLLYVPVEVISLCHHHCNLAEQRPSALILFHHGKNHLYMSMSYWAGDYRRVQFHQC